MKRSVLRAGVAGLLLSTFASGRSSGVSGSLAQVDERVDRSADASRATAPRGRLPTDVKPLAYRVELALDPRRDDFSGAVEIDVELARATNRIWLHGQSLEVAEATALTEEGGTVNGLYEEILSPGVSRLTFSEGLPPGRATLRLSYTGQFSRNLAGLFKVEERGDSYALAKSESIQARSYLPCFDEPGLKATFDFQLTIPEGYQAILNGREIERQPAGPDLERVRFATTTPMPTYLLSLAVGPFDVVDRSPIPPNAYRSRPVPLRGVARRGRGGDLAYVLDVTPRIVEIFERELKQPYPFDKLDIVAAPQWPTGATELSAAITYREQLILVGDEPAPGTRLSLLRTHAHEVAHMWFGNLVTPPWWEDLWLKEGFATWAAPVVLSALEPEGGHDLEAAGQAIEAMKLDSLASTRAIREPITDNDDVRNAYDSITYAKSLGVIHMADQYFGADRFRQALGRYLETFGDGVADSTDFYDVIGRETGLPALTDTFRSFVEQKGVPLLDVAIRCGDVGTAVSVTQTRYEPLGSPIGDEKTRWTIPVCLRTNEWKQCLMLTEPAQTIDLDTDQCPAWVLPNAGGSGYYRWNLETDGWRALADSFSTLSPVEALSVVDSAFAAFEAGRLPEAALLDVVQASARSRKRRVVTAPLSRLATYREQYLSGEAAFLRLAVALYRPVIERTAASRDDDERLLHAQLTSFMALTAGDPLARTDLRDRAYVFTGYAEPRDPGALPSDLYLAALRVALQDSDAGFLRHLLAFRREVDDPRFEAASASAIGAVTDPVLLDEVHAIALGDELGPRESFDLLAVALREPETRDEHWSWLRDNFARVVARVPAQWRRRTPAFGAGFCDADKLAELRQLFARQGDLAPGHERSLAQTEETIALCMALRERGRALGPAIAERAPVYTGGLPRTDVERTELDE